jgi:hypothetical protein
VGRGERRLDRDPDGKGWTLLKDQFGIRLTHKDPNAWKIGEMKGIDLATGNAKQLAAGEIRTVEWLRERRTASGTVWGNFYLMLTGVVEADQMAKVVADKRPASPTVFTIESVVDAASEYQPKRLYRNSWNEVARGSPSDKDFTIFDQDMAQAYVDTKRESSQLGQFSMKVAIPRLTAAYTIGDRIRQINGRDCSFCHEFDWRDRDDGLSEGHRVHLALRARRTDVAESCRTRRSSGVSWRAGCKLVMATWP